MKASTFRTVSAKVLHSIVSVLLVFAMIFVFSACQSNTVDPNETVDIGGGSEGERTAPAQTADLSRLVRISLRSSAPVAPCPRSAFSLWGHDVPRHGKMF